MEIFHAVRKNFVLMIMAFCVHKVYVLNTLCTTTVYGSTFQGRTENSITSTVESRPHTTAVQEAVKLRS